MVSFNNLNIFIIHIVANLLSNAIGDKIPGIAFQLNTEGFVVATKDILIRYLFEEIYEFAVDDYVYGKNKFI